MASEEGVWFQGSLHYIHLAIGAAKILGALAQGNKVSSPKVCTLFAGLALAACFDGKLSFVAGC